MQVADFWRHWQVTEDPFRAEEAREDPVFLRLADHQTTHPDFEKVFGRPDHPGPAVVFGEKGSGKTALRLLMEKRIAEHNAAHPDRKAWVVLHDDLNGVLDRFAASTGKRNDTDDALLSRFSLVDHQDAVLSLAVTRLATALLDNPAALGENAAKKARRMGWSRRVDLATLAALYDQPRGSAFTQRWPRLRRTLRLGTLSSLGLAKVFGVTFAIASMGIAIAVGVTGQRTDLNVLLIAVTAAAATLLIGFWLFRHAQLWRLSRRVLRAMRVTERTGPQLRTALADLPMRELSAQPLPLPDSADSRYQLTARLLNVLEAFGYTGVIVLVDRLDEPVRVHGDAKRMRNLVWPMFDNKFLQQDRIGFKLLLPVELAHLLRREEGDFYQRARLDKQHMIERLVWSGTTLYDLCSHRLSSCRPTGSPPITLTDLFDPEVHRQDLIDALDQMHQPRDAMKFLYRVVQEHCSNVPAEDPAYRIPRLVLQNVRKAQSQRVQDLQRGLSPA